MGIIASGNKSLETVMKIKDDWNNFLADYGKYPKLPYNEVTGNLEYTFTNEYSLSKEIIFDRILEWACLNFGSIDAVLHYKNIVSGKVILKGYFNVLHEIDYKNFWGIKKESNRKTEIFQTYIFTIKDSKLKVQITNIEVEFVYAGYGSGTYYVPETKSKYDINTIYPVTQFQAIDWKSNLSLLEQTDNKINFLLKDLNNYILSYSKDYSF